MTTQAVSVNSIHHQKTGTWQYIVADPTTLDAVIIDPVLDFDQDSERISTESADGLLSLIQAKGYSITRILETHAHADHLTAAAYLQRVLAQRQGNTPPICIGKRIRGVQETFASKYEVTDAELAGAFDYLFADDETFKIGALDAKVIHLPGHTPDHIGYEIRGEASFTRAGFIIEHPTNVAPR